MKKLQSLAAFTALPANDMALLMGGVSTVDSVDGTTVTGGGSRQIMDACGKVACISHWTSDCIDATGIEYYGTSVTYP